jgi:hypothetical protein
MPRILSNVRVKKEEGWCPHFCAALKRCGRREKCLITSPSSISYSDTYNATSLIRTSARPAHAQVSKIMHPRSLSEVSWIEGANSLAFQALLFTGDTATESL